MRSWNVAPRIARAMIFYLEHVETLDDLCNEGLAYSSFCIHGGHAGSIGEMEIKLQLRGRMSVIGVRTESRSFGIEQFD